MSRKLMHTPWLGALRCESAEFNNLIVMDSSVLGYYVMSMGKHLLAFRKNAVPLFLALLKIKVLCDITAYRLVNNYSRFEGL